MLGVNQLDFVSYTSLLKGNYQKGVHRLRAILSVKEHAEEFATNKGAVAVVLGTPVDHPDQNSEQLITMLLESDVVDMAVETFLHSFYQFEILDNILKNKDICSEIIGDPMLWRAARSSDVTASKLIATIAGLNCENYTTIDQIVKKDSDITVVSKNKTAIELMIDSYSEYDSYMYRLSLAVAGLSLSAFVEETTLIENTTALTTVADNHMAMWALANCGAAMELIATNGTLLTLVLGKASALWGIAQGNKAKSLLIANNNLLSNSTLVTSIVSALTGGANYFSLVQAAKSYNFVANTEVQAADYTSDSNSIVIALPYLSSNPSTTTYSIARHGHNGVVARQSTYTSTNASYRAIALGGVTFHATGGTPTYARIETIIYTVRKNI